MSPLWFAIALCLAGIGSALFGLFGFTRFGRPLIGWSWAAIGAILFFIGAEGLLQIAGVVGLP